MTTNALSFLNLAPDTFVEGGLIDDINAKITDAKFTMYDYNGKSDRGAVPALGLELELEDGVKHEQYYSAGDAKYWAPSTDGKTLVPTSDKSSLAKSSKLGIFLSELVNAGFPADKLRTGDITCLVGMVAHFIRKADKERKGLVRAADAKEQNTLVVSKIIGLPGEAPKATPKQTAVGAPQTASSAQPSAAPAASGSTGDVDDDTTNLLLETIPANGGSVAKNRISQLVFKTIVKDHPLFAKRTAITQRAMQDDFLKAGADSGLWEFDGTTIKIG